MINLQKHLYNAIINNSRDIKSREEITRNFRPIKIISEEKEREKFDWRNPKDPRGTKDDESLKRPFDDVAEYLRKNLPDLVER